MQAVDCFSENAYDRAKSEVFIAAGLILIQVTQTFWQEVQDAAGCQREGFPSVHCIE